VDLFVDPGADLFFRSTRRSGVWIHEFADLSMDLHVDLYFVRSAPKIRNCMDLDPSFVGSLSGSVLLTFVDLKKSRSVPRSSVMWI
jgi:hypothetical protein